MLHFLLINKLLFLVTFVFNLELCIKSFTNKQFATNDKVYFTYYLQSTAFFVLTYHVWNLNYIQVSDKFLKVFFSIVCHW